MTGVGALFELYSNWQDSKKDKKEEEEELKLEPEGEEEHEGFFDEESEWHYVIENRDWDALLDMLQNYDYHKYKPKEPDKNSKRLRVIGAAIWVKEKVKPSKPKEKLKSPLLALNALGQTPLHVAIKNGAPDKYVIRLVFCEKRAALIPDESGHLPLHLACIVERNTAVVDRCIRANFHHMQQEDKKGRTPLWYAVDRVQQKGTQIDGYWGIPRNSEDAKWQGWQEVIWAKVRFLLLSYSTRRKVMAESEREILLLALKHGAPPVVVEVTILAAQGMLHTDPTLASSALTLFMKAQYPIKNLQLLLHHFPVERVESLEAARKILGDNYHRGNVTMPGREISFRAEMEKHALEENYKRTLLCREWWDKIRCLLKVCGHGNNKEHKKEFSNEHLLHAALSNCDTPPSLVQLLMVMSPESIKLPHPFNKSLLIHLICRNWKYNLFPQSKGINVISEQEEPPMEQVLKILLVSDATLARKRHEGRLPLHHAVVTQKSLVFLESLVNADDKTLKCRDPQTKLFPFQMAAMGGTIRNAALWARAQYSEFEWKHLDPQVRGEAVNEAREEQDQEQLTNIFYLLKKMPNAITSGAMLRKPAVFRDDQGKGMVSTHFLVFLYKQKAEDNYVLQKDKLELIQAAIESKHISRDLEEWWQKMKFWIWFCYGGSEDLPSHEEDYLLHAAVDNPDTPPLVIQLLLAMYPKSARLPVNGEVTFPLHIAAAAPAYKPQFYEITNTLNVFEMLVRTYPEAASIQCPVGSPIDIAQANGRSEEEVRPLLEGFMKEVMADMQTSYVDLTVADMKKPRLEDVETSSQGELSEMTDYTPSTQDNTTFTRSMRL